MFPFFKKIITFLRISYVLSVYFDHIHSSLQLLLDPAPSSPPSLLHVLFFFFFNNLTRPYSKHESKTRVLQNKETSSLEANSQETQKENFDLKVISSELQTKAPIKGSH